MLDRRRKEATEEEIGKFERVLNINYMSEDENATVGEGWRHLELTWRSDDVTKFFYELDKRSESAKKEFQVERIPRTQSGISTLRAPKNAPDWAIKTIQDDTPLTRNPGRGRGIRTRGGRKSAEKRGLTTYQTATRETNQRRGINFSRDDILNDVTHS